MEPSGNQPQFELPPPASGGDTVERSGVVPAAERSVAREQISAAAPARGLQPAHMPASVPPAIAQLVAAAPAGQTPVSSAGLQAQDADLIEREWVEKAKEIVRQTRLDPHVQNREISRIKADYIQKRYGKHIKVAED